MINLTDYQKFCKKYYKITDKELNDLMNCPYCKGSGFEGGHISINNSHCRISEHYHIFTKIYYYTDFLKSNDPPKCLNCGCPFYFLMEKCPECGAPFPLDE